MWGQRERERSKSKGCVSRSPHCLARDQSLVKPQGGLRHEQITAKVAKKREYLQKPTVSKSVSRATESEKEDLQNFHVTKSLVATLVS